MTLSLTHFSNGVQEQETPEWLFREQDLEFGFTLDVCATAKNAKCDRFISPEQDGLMLPWIGEVCWMNPPFNEAGRWVERAWYAARREGATVVCLLPGWSDVAWWHDWVMRADEIRYVRGRLKFNRAKRHAPMAIVLVVYRPNSEDPLLGPRVGPTPRKPEPADG